MRACSLLLQCRMQSGHGTREREGRLDDACIRCLIAESRSSGFIHPLRRPISLLLPLSFVCMHAKGQTLKHDDRDETDWPFVTRSTASEYQEHRRSHPPLLSPRFLHICCVTSAASTTAAAVAASGKIRTNCRAGERFSSLPAAIWTQDHGNQGNG